MIEAILVSLGIAFICTYVIGWQDFFHSFLARVYTVFFGKEVMPSSVRLPKVMECPLCCTTWLVLIYLIIVMPFSFSMLVMSICLALVIGFSTKWIYYIFEIIDSFISGVLSLLEKCVNKLRVL